MLVEELVMRDVKKLSACVTREDGTSVKDGGAQVGHLARVKGRCLDVTHRELLRSRW